MNRDEGRCAYCGGHAITVDHVLPRSYGGKNTWRNTVAACGGCNQRKGDRTPAARGTTAEDLDSAGSNPAEGSCRRS